MYIYILYLSIFIYIHIQKYIKISSLTYFISIGINICIIHRIYSDEHINHINENRTCLMTKRATMRNRFLILTLPRILSSFDFVLYAATCCRIVYSGPRLSHHRTGKTAPSIVKIQLSYNGIRDTAHYDKVYFHTEYSTAS